MPRTQQLFVTSRNRDTGSPGDCTFSFANGLIENEDAGHTIDFELVNFSIPRIWYDVVAGVNNQFTLRRSDGASAVFPLDPGYYTAGPDVLGAGGSLPTQLAQKLTGAIDATVWTVSVNNITGAWILQAFTNDGAYGSYTLDLSLNASPRIHEILGMLPGSTLTSLSHVNGPRANSGYEPFNPPRPFIIMRTTSLVLHTDIKTNSPNNTLDNFGPNGTLFTPSDVLAVIPVDQPARGLITYLDSDQGNILNLAADSIRSIRFFITDHRELPIDLAGAEWNAVFRITHYE